MRSPYLTVLLTVSLAAVALTMAANWAVDPLRYYHRPWFEIGYSDNQRFQNPGLVRHEAYDTVLVGTSHTEHFTSAEMDRLLGVRSVNLSMSGSSIVEQNALVRLVLESGKARRVLWEINYPSFSTGETANRDFEFPQFLYQPGAETPFRYLASWDTLQESLAALTGRRPQRLDDMHRWDLEYPFGADRVLANWDHMQQRWNDALRTVWGLYSVNIDDVPLLFERYVGAVVLSHPEVRFDLLLLPTSMLDYSNDFQVSRQRFAKRLALREAAAALAGSPANVAVWDFEQNLDWSRDLDRFKDLEHFDGRTVREILAGMAGGARPATAVEIRAGSERLARAVVDHTRAFCAEYPARCQPYLAESLAQFERL